MERKSTKEFRSYNFSLGRENLLILYIHFPLEFHQVVYIPLYEFLLGNILVLVQDFVN